MKKLVAFFLSAILFLMPFAVFASAEDIGAPEIEVYVNDHALFLNEKAFLPKKGLMFSVGLSLNNFENGISEGEIKITFSGETLKFTEQIIPEIFVPGSDSLGMPVFMPVPPYIIPETTAVSENEIKVTLTGAEKPSWYYDNAAVYENFFVKNTGELDFSVTAADFKDADGNTVEPKIVYTDFPTKAYILNDIPLVKLDYDKCLAYGLIYDATIELANPMTAGEFRASVSDEGARVIIKDAADEKILGDDELIPTGAVFRLVFDNVPLLTAHFVLIGDVDGDAKITSADARLALRYAAKLDESLGEYGEIAANAVPGSTVIAAADAREILRISAGIGISYDEMYKYHCVLKKYYTFLYNDNLR